jgi:hypothetical protein|tara:strand:- start:5681 stop:7108 length:1428 start_codon:yes stop_codon:yes gene_type:complete
MSYFNHAFSKAFLAKTHEQTNTQTSADLSVVGEFAILASDFGIMAAADLQNNKGGFYLAQAAFQANDKIGNNPGMGGYKESSKSKMIMSKYISSMWVSDCTAEVADIGRLTIKATADNQSCFPCDVQPMFRADIKGTAVLRFLNHNAYATLNGALPMPATNAQDGTGALSFSAAVTANGVDMCCGTQDPTGSVGIAPSIVAINLRDQFNNDPILSKFATAKLYVSTNSGATFTAVSKAQEEFIYDGGALGVAAGIASATTGTSGVWAVADQYRVDFEMKTSCALQTQFGDSSFDTRDFYLMGDLKTIVDMQDETGAACVPCLNYVTFAESAQEFKQRRTSADTAARDILLTESYRQSPYTQGTKDASRMREQEGVSGIITAIGRDATTSGAGDCVGAYRVYHLLHNVPRFNNPSGMFNNDQYHYKVYVPCSGAGAATTSIDNDWVTIAIQAGIMKRDGSAVVSSIADLEALGGDY